MTEQELREDEIKIVVEASKIIREYLGEGYEQPAYDMTALILLKYKEAGYVKLKPGEYISGVGEQKLPDVIGTTLDGQPLIKQVGGR